MGDVCYCLCFVYVGFGGCEGWVVGLGGGNLCIELWIVVCVLLVGGGLVCVVVGGVDGCVGVECVCFDVSGLGFVVVYVCVIGYY